MADTWVCEKHQHWGSLGHYALKKCPLCQPVANVPSGDTVLPELVATDEDRVKARTQLVGIGEYNAKVDRFIRERQLLHYKAKYEEAERTIAELKGA